MKRKYASEKEAAAAYRKRHLEQIRIYNREYRRRKRRAEMTPEQLERCNRLAAARDARKPQGVAREVIDRLAAENNQTPDEMTAWCVEKGALDFLLKAIAPRMAKRNYNRDRLMRTAIQATRLYLYREAAVMDWRPGTVGSHAKRSAPVIDVEARNAEKPIR